uniref:Uncharacterized protein n=1 Tax=Esox lucius TaxID=8010 RepID=A0AAY5KK20_ESOLU
MTSSTHFESRNSDWIVHLFSSPAPLLLLSCSSSPPLILLSCSLHSMSEVNITEWDPWSWGELRTPSPPPSWPACRPSHINTPLCGFPAQGTPPLYNEWPPQIKEWSLTRKHRRASVSVDQTRTSFNLNKSRKRRDGPDEYSNHVKPVYEGTHLHVCIPP